MPMIMTRALLTYSSRRMPGMVGAAVLDCKGRLLHTPIRREIWPRSLVSRRVCHLTPQCDSTRRRWLAKLRKPCPTRLTFLMSRLTASVGPLEQPMVEWKAKISACQVRRAARLR